MPESSVTVITSKKGIKRIEDDAGREGMLTLMGKTGSSGEMETKQRAKDQWPDNYQPRGSRSEGQPYQTLLNGEEDERNANSAKAL